MQCRWSKILYIEFIGRVCAILSTYLIFCHPITIAFIFWEILHQWSKLTPSNVGLLYIKDFLILQQGNFRARDTLVAFATYRWRLLQRLKIGYTVCKLFSFQPEKVANFFLVTLYIIYHLFLYFLTQFSLYSLQLTTFQFF